MTQSTDRWLIVNADDFGQSYAINRGVIAAFEYGVVTSASLMVRWPASTDAAKYAREHPALSLGLHVDLGEWIYRGETWVPIYQVLPTADPDGYRCELDHQLSAFRALTRQDPTHLDSHQHVHSEEPLRSILIDTAASLQIPVRNFDPRVRYDGSFYGQSGRGDPVPHAIEVDSLLQLIETLPAGVTELGCHPGEIDAAVESMYRTERAREVCTLCDPRVRERIRSAGVELCSFRDLRLAGIWRTTGAQAGQ
jgi:chitin disaccharide deacetylase